MTRQTAGYGLPYPRPTTASVSTAMRANRRTDTKPELALRSSLHRRGLRFRKDYRVDLTHRKIRVDVAFPSLQLAIFLDGCYWHQCPEHGTIPKANSDYWAPKLARNAARDKEITAALEAEGWRVLRIWEHVPVEEAAGLVAEAVAARRKRMSTALAG